MEIRLRDFKWPGMLSFWGQSGVAYQGICYNRFSYDPKEYVKVGHDCPPIEKYFVRFVSLEDAQFWLDYLRRHIIPERVLERVTFTRVQRKAHWYRLCKEELAKDEVIDEFDGDINDPKFVGQYHGTVPWLKVEFSQELTPEDIFTLANFLRYVSEHGDIIKLISVLHEFLPEVPEHHYLYIASFMCQATNHAVGVTCRFPRTKIKETLDKFVWKKFWEKMSSNLEPFWKTPVKMVQINNYFTLPFPKLYWHFIGEEEKVSGNNVSIRTRCGSVHEILSAIKKEFA